MTLHIPDERWKHDAEFDEYPLEDVKREGDGYALKRDGWHLWIADPGFEPKVGQMARYYGRGIGSVVRGVVIDGLVCRYQTADEMERQHRNEIEDRQIKQKAEAEANRAENDARIAALPVKFQQRIQRFRDGNPAFEWDHQPYELFCCEEAVKIATALKERHREDAPAFAKLDWEQQKQIVPTLDSGHSGNTFGTAVRLAHWYLTRPENVVREHGALTPLVGCDAYGCTHVAGDSDHA